MKSIHKFQFTIAILVSSLFSLQSCQESKKIEVKNTQIDTVSKVIPNDSGYMDYTNYPRTYFILEKNVSVYATPNYSSKLEKSFEIGDSVRVLAEQSLEENQSYDSLWTKVEVSIQNQNIIGYIPSKSLSTAGAKSIDNPFHQYLIRKQDIKSPNGLMIYQLLHIKKGEIIRSFVLDTFYAHEPFEIKPLKLNIGIKNVKELVFVKKLAEACGVESYDYIYTNINDNLQFLYQNWGVSDGGVFYSSKDIHVLKNKQYYAINDYDEPQPIERIPDEVYPYLDSPQYFMVLDEEAEVEYDEAKKEEKMDQDGNPIFKKNREIYTFYKWMDKKGLKEIRKIDLIDNSIKE